MKKQETFVSIVLSIYNQGNSIITHLEQLVPYLQSRYSDFEIVIIDRFSKDNTEKKIDKLLKEQPSIRYIRLTKVVENEIAVSVGLDNAIGDFAINWQLADPIDNIDAMVSKAKQGMNIIIGTSKEHTTTKCRLLRKLSQRLITEATGYTLPANSTGSFCLSRQAINTVTESSRYYWKLYITLANSGHKFTPYEYDFVSQRPQKRIFDGIRETVHYLIFNSTKPLRWMSLLGVFGSLMAFVFALYSLLANIFRDQVVEGWTTTILFISFLFSILFTMLSFFGEYLARLLEDSSEHASYHILYEKNSVVMLDFNRQNVMFDAQNY